MDPGWTLISGRSVCKSMRNLVGASGFEPPTSWSRTINPRNIKDLAVAQQLCAGLRYVASLQRLPGLLEVGTGNRGQGFYVWGGHKNGHSFHQPELMDLTCRCRRF